MGLVFFGEIFLVSCLLIVNYKQDSTSNKSTQFVAWEAAGVNARHTTKQGV